MIWSSSALTVCPGSGAAAARITSIVGCGNVFVGADVEGQESSPAAAPLDVTVASDPTPSGCPSIVLAATAAAAGANLLFETVAKCSNFVSKRLLLAGGRGVAAALLVVMSAILCGGWSRGIAKLLVPLLSGFLSELELVPAMLPKTCTSRSCNFCESEDRAGADEWLLAIAAGTWELDASNDPFSKSVMKTS
jgi:hypothetical protein